MGTPYGRSVSLGNEWVPATAAALRQARTIPLSRHLQNSEGEFCIVNFLFKKAKVEKLTERVFCRVGNQTTLAFVVSGELCEFVGLRNG